MKLTLILGVLALVLLCIVEETSAHAGNTSINKINSNPKMSESEKAEARRQKILKKKQNRKDKGQGGDRLKMK